MPGVIEKVLIAEGAQVKAGDPLVVMIAMKMEVSNQMLPPSPPFTQTFQ
jgi:acetyl/propionyl-CoA carboxylase alpha subunit